MAKAMNKQMEMFQDGGLEQDGGTVDPVSGNDVPVGSSQEEVRDDIPAQLSEGEFVFPADVVRFIGLEKLMIMRQEAKSGLKRMEDMGQMGNSEEATIPDDIPFSIDDLELEDEQVSASKGGAVKLQEGGMPEGVSFEEGQYIKDYSLPVHGPELEGFERPVDYEPKPTQEYKSPTVADVPVTEPTNPLPKFNVFVPPAADEYREYINDEGIIINVPYFRGNILPGYTLPVGFRLKETATEEEGITEDALLDITEPEQEDRESRIQREEEERKSRERSYDNVVKQIMEENKGLTIDEIKKKIKDGESTINIFGKKIKAPGFLFNEDDIESAYNRTLTGRDYQDELDTDYGDDSDKDRGTAFDANFKAKQEAEAQAKAEAEAAAYQKSRLIAKQKAEEEFAKKVAEEKALADAIKEAEKQSKIESAAQAIADRKKEAAKREAAAEANRKRIADEQAAKEAAKSRQQRLADEQERDQRQRERDAAQAERERDTRQQREEKSQSKREGGRGYVRAKGGIIERPKKKMKRGGLASKK